ncbi:MAG: AAA family ATPase [Nitrososphaerales archaeon]|nr:AAA family ATPase [Nitrososphaerales archaeon]
MKIVAITGMPGAGKSTAAQALVARGWKRVVMGDVIREETRRRGLTADEKNTGEVMRELRKQYGEAAVAELCMRAIKKSGSETVVVDGIRSLAEVETFRRSAEVLLVAIHASSRRRFDLLRERGRSDDPASYEMFLRRDERELDVGIGKAVALADEVVSNERNTPEGLSRQMVELVERWAHVSA